MRWPALAAVMAAVLGLSPDPAAAQSAARRPVRDVAPDSFGVPYPGGTARMPVHVSADWRHALPSVTRAVVVFHGIGRDASGYFAAARKARDLSGVAADSALVLAPQYLADIDMAPHHAAADMLFWGPNTWSDGGPAKGPAPVSAFEVIDAILARLADRSLFPSLRQVTLAGHSAGGQLVQRYAVVGRGVATLTAAGIAVDTIVANPSSYVYFTPDRPVAVAAGCARFDSWKYGFHDSVPAYVTEAAATLEARYAGRLVTYLLGTADTNPNLAVLDKSCMAEAQGTDHLSRGRAYFAMMQRRHPSGLNQTLVEVPGVGHSAAGMFESAAGVAALFK